MFKFKSDSLPALRKYFCEGEEVKSVDGQFGKFWERSIKTEVTIERRALEI